MTRYVPSRHYLEAGLAAILFGSFSVWCGLRWTPAFLAAALFILSAAVLFYLARRPAIEIHRSHLRIGRRNIVWSDIRRLDRAGSLTLLLVNITLFDDSRVLLIYPGDLDSANSLLRDLRRNSRDALIEGRPYREFWGEGAADEESRPMPTPRYRLLRPEDEADIEEIYRRLKSVRHLDPDSSKDEK